MAGNSHKDYFHSADISSLTELVTSPAFVTDLEKVRQNTLRFRTLFPDTQLFYSVKTGPAPGVVDTMLQMGSSFDAATIPEIEMVLARGAQADTILYTHPVKSSLEIKQAERLGIQLYTFDSLEELKKLHTAAPGKRYLLRLLPPSSHSLYDYSGKFGADKKNAYAILDYALAHHIPVAGLSFHVGSQNSSIKPWKDVFKLISQLIDEYYPKMSSLRIINVGSGFPEQYDFERPVVSLEEISAVFHKLKASLPADLIYFSEPGRPIVATSTILITRIFGKVQRNKTHWLYVDANVYSGLIEILESSGRFRYPVSSFKRGNLVPYYVSGKTLDPDDILAKNVMLSERLDEPDPIIIHDVGAYYSTFFTSYHSLPQPTMIDVDSAFAANVELGVGDMGITGIRAKRAIPKGETVFVVTGGFSKERTRTSFQVDHNRHIEPNLFGAFLNHSCNPNVGIVTGEFGLLQVVARRDIKKHEEVAADYAMFEYETGPMSKETCLCKSKLCRKKITGYKYLDAKTKQRYHGLVATYLTEY